MFLLLHLLCTSTSTVLIPVHVSVDSSVIVPMFVKVVMAPVPVSVVYPAQFLFFFIVPRFCLCCLHAHLCFLNPYKYL